MLQSIDTLIAFVVIMTVASVIVTIVVQMLSAALSLRGKNLANGLALTFQTIDPTLAEKAHQLAAKILSDPLLSDSAVTDKDKRLATSTAQNRPWKFTDLSGAMRLASAIRPEEVYAALKRLASHSSSASALHVGARRTDEQLAETARKLLDALMVPPEEAAAIKAHLGTFLEIAEQVTDAPVKEKLLALVEDTPAHLMVETDAARAKFTAWFNSAQDRAQQWFQLNTRALTIAASIVIAFVLQLDAVDVFRYVSTNAAARAALVADANRVIREADGALDEKGGLIKRIADAWATKTGQPPLNLAGITQTAQLQAALANQDAELKPEEFDAVVAASTRTYYHDQREKMAELTRGVNATGFEFIPSGYWRWPAPRGVGESFFNIVSHLPGIAIFAALLSLGAPYWYNLLKNLASLRPAVARLISQEKAARNEKGK